MESPSSSKRVASGRRDDDRESVRDGIGMDGEWEYQRVFEGAYRCESAGARTFLIRGPYLPLTLKVTRPL